MFWSEYGEMFITITVISETGHRIIADIYYILFLLLNIYSFALSK